MKKIKKIGVIIFTITVTCNLLAGCDVEEMMMGGGNKVEKKLTEDNKNKIKKILNEDLYNSNFPH